MENSKAKALTPFIIFALLIVFLVIGLRHSKPEAPKFAQHIGDPAPATDLPLLNGGGAHFTTTLWRGRPYVLNFFASWCADCKAEHEELMTLSASHLPIIGITFKDKADKAAAYLTRVGDPFIAVAQDDDGRAGIDWGLTGVPETFVVDAHGIIRWHHISAITDDIATSELMPLWESLSQP
jgi:cytochrome c biogenesis protein CcmG/thiol:disulfide interchange protein DsbE